MRNRYLTTFGYGPSEFLLDLGFIESTNEWTFGLAESSDHETPEEYFNEVWDAVTVAQRQSGGWDTLKAAQEDVAKALRALSTGRKRWGGVEWDMVWKRD